MKKYILTIMVLSSLSMINAISLSDIKKKAEEGYGTVKKYGTKAAGYAGTAAEYAGTGQEYVEKYGGVVGQYGGPRVQKGVETLGTGLGATKQYGSTAHDVLGQMGMGGQK